MKLYNSLINELIRNGIQPYVTLYHWHLAQALSDRHGGMLIQDEYTADLIRYVRLCFERFGDEVESWIAYNESAMTARYSQGRNPPGHVSETEPFIVAHTQLASHGYVVAMYRRDFQPTQSGMIMITLGGNWYEPWDKNDPKDIEAA